MKRGKIKPKSYKIVPYKGKQTEDNTNATDIKDIKNKIIQLKNELIQLKNELIKLIDKQKKDFFNSSKAIFCNNFVKGKLFDTVKVNFDYFSYFISKKEEDYKLELEKLIYIKKILIEFETTINDLSDISLVELKQRFINKIIKNYTFDLKKNYF